jgi:predicted alpha/beta-hydrolase family hydrolase
MDSASMTAAAQALAAAGLGVARFEFGYMARRRTEGGRKPPPRAETLVPEYCAAVAALDTSDRSSSAATRWAEGWPAWSRTSFMRRA